LGKNPFFEWWWASPGYTFLARMFFPQLGVVSCRNPSLSQRFKSVLPKKFHKEDHKPVKSGVVLTPLIGVIAIDTHFKGHL